MNAQDKSRLADEWFKQTEAAEVAMQGVIRAAQDHAYQLGFERGCKEPGFFETYFPNAKTWDEVFLAIEALEDQRDSLLAALKNASCALCDAERFTDMRNADDAIGQVDAPYLQLAKAA